MTVFSIAGNLSGIIEIEACYSPARMLEMLRSSEASYGVITDDSGPLSLVTEEDLTALSLDGLADPAARLPELVSMRDKPDVLNTREITALARLISGRNVSAVLVDDGARPVGALARDGVANALPLAELRIFGTRWGPPRVPSLGFVCRKCVPPSYRLPRSTGSEAPVCRLSYFHGPMELLSDEVPG